MSPRYLEGPDPVLSPIQAGYAIPLPDALRVYLEVLGESDRNWDRLQERAYRAWWRYHTTRVLWCEQCQEDVRAVPILLPTGTPRWRCPHDGSLLYVTGALSRPYRPHYVPRTPQRFGPSRDYGG